MTDDTSYDTTERVDQYEHDARLHIRSKHGTGTRDEDKVSGELHAESVDALEANREHLRNQVVDILEDLRHTQPDSDQQKSGLGGAPVGVRLNSGMMNVNGEYSPTALSG
jgi:hypothetical protein